MGGESQAFPELYNLWIVIEEFPYEDFIFGDVQLTLHRPEGEAAIHSYHFPRLIRDYDRDDPWMDYAEQFIEQDLFTPSEVAAIEAYFSRRSAQGMALHKELQAFPIASDQVPCNAAGYGGWDGEYLFDMEEGFDCPIKFWGYYWLGGTRRYPGLFTSNVGQMAHSACQAEQTATCSVRPRLQCSLKAGCGPKSPSRRRHLPSEARYCRSMGCLARPKAGRYWPPPETTLKTSKRFRRFRRMVKGD